MGSYHYELRREREQAAAKKAKWNKIKEELKSLRNNNEVQLANRIKLNNIIKKNDATELANRIKLNNIIKKNSSIRLANNIKLSNEESNLMKLSKELIKKKEIYNSKELSNNIKISNEESNLVKLSNELMNSRKIANSTEIMNNIELAKNKELTKNNEIENNKLLNNIKPIDVKNKYIHEPSKGIINSTTLISTSGEVKPYNNIVKYKQSIVTSGNNIYNKPDDLLHIENVNSSKGSIVTKGTTANKVGLLDIVKKYWWIGILVVGHII